MRLNSGYEPDRCSFGGMVCGAGVHPNFASAVPNSMRPWEETAVTMDVFAYRSVNSASFANPDTTILTPVIILDSATVVGTNIRAQYNSLELNTGIYWETHNHAAGDGSGSRLIAPYGELSYVGVSASGRGAVFLLLLPVEGPPPMSDVPSSDS